MVDEVSHDRGDVGKVQRAQFDQKEHHLEVDDDGDDSLGQPH